MRNNKELIRILKRFADELDVKDVELFIFVVYLIRELESEG